MVKTEETSIPNTIDVARGAQRSPPEIISGSKEITVVIIPIIIGRILVLQA